MKYETLVVDGECRYGSSIESHKIALSKLEDWLKDNSDKYKVISHAVSVSPKTSTSYCVISVILEVL